MSISIQSGRVRRFSASRKTGWLTVNFPVPFTSTPTVFAQVQTFSGPDTPGIRIQNVTANSFEVRMDELQASGSTSSTQGNLGKFVSDGISPNPEVLGWMAIA